MRKSIKFLEERHAIAIGYNSIPTHSLFIIFFPFRLFRFEHKFCLICLICCRPPCLVCCGAPSYFKETHIVFDQNRIFQTISLFVLCFVYLINFNSHHRRQFTTNRCIFHFLFSQISLQQT